MTLEDFLTRLVDLDAAQLALLREMVDALRRPCDVVINPASDLVSIEFSDSLLNRFRIHHATSEEKFKKASFEYAFIAAARFAGHSATKTVSQTYQGADVIVDRTRWSLKTEASSSISVNSITISKFSEARWVRECLSPEDFARESVPRVLRHLSEYDRIAVLRAFSVLGSDCVRYDLIEIPKELIEKVTHLTADDFSPRTRNGSSMARVIDDQGLAFTLRLDGSVEKITLSGIPVKRCVFHGRWEVPVIPEASE